jgi:hypothetical protein
MNLYDIPEIKELLEHPVKRGKMVSGKFEVEETKMLGEVLGRVEKYIDFYEDSGLPLINHRGILKLVYWIGGRILEPRKEDVPRQENHRGYAYLMSIEFPDGEISYQTGEASELNTDDRNASGKYKQNQAFIRGLNKAFLRSNYIGLLDIFSEEEAEEFKTPAVERVANEYKLKIKEMIKGWKEKEKRYGVMIREMIPYIALPEDDEDFPNEKVKNVLHHHEDLRKMKEILRGEDKILKFAVKNLLKEFEEEKERKKIEEALKEEVEPEIEKSIEENVEEDIEENTEENIEGKLEENIEKTEESLETYLEEEK